MKLVKSEKLEHSMHEIQFSIDADVFQAAVEKAFKREGKKYAVQGFRKGKAPRKMIERIYGADVFFYDAINDLFPAEYDQAVQEAGIDVVGQPTVDIVSMKLEEGVVLKAVAPVKPEVELGDYIGLEGEKKVKAVKDEDVEAELSRMQERNGRLINIEEAAAIGDTAEIDFDGSVDGVAFDGGKAEHYDLELGSNSFIPGFEDQVIGHVAGDEFDVNVTFPEDYGTADLAGKAAVFKIKLHTVKRKELPALDDDFAQDVSEFDTLDELKADIRKRQEEIAEKRAAAELENTIVDKVVEGMKAEIPDAMIENRLDSMVQEYEYNLMQQGMRLNDYLKYLSISMEDFRANFKENAEKHVKTRLALEAVVAKESITADDADVDAKIKEMAEQYSMEEDKIRSLINLDDLKSDVAVQKAIDFLVSKANVKVVDADAAAAEAKSEE